MRNRGCQEAHVAGQTKFSLFVFPLLPLLAPRRDYRRGSGTRLLRSRCADSGIRPPFWKRERQSPARVGTLRSCIAGPVLTSGTACLRPISRPSFGASSTSTWTPSMRSSNSATIQACVACRWRLEAHRGQAAGAAADVHHAVTVCEAAKLHQQRCQPPAPLSHHLFIGVG